ncbi:alpha/beta fold hydrolase [Jatrophihabitans lederbergiae]|uniref:Alpha/beta hydrolase n=1 Tax=Jatrophihabitans lederbergiae TaxID=3075547 RepID=A0ABU2JEE8_9ACTN|nr:alpha/beta hydrolase [Jatrophihabitans sp. DSM 44399]MDT0263355.1 alpha/beta hydrolase [Jatrophihabitans sp. DSM 44399]
MTIITTAVLVHGALSDASIWKGVSARLQSQGHRVLAPAMPMRSLDGDVSYLKAFLASIDGPVVLAGHSWGGTVISHPAFASEQVKGLVFVSAFQPEAGESTGELNGKFPGSLLGEPRVVVRARPGGNDLYLKPEHFAEVYAGDLQAETVAVMAAAQRPIDPAALGESFDRPASWTSIPSWTLVSTADDSLPPAAMRFMAERAGSHTVEVASSHASPASNPDAVAGLVHAALTSAA